MLFVTIVFLGNFSNNTMVVYKSQWGCELLTIPVAISSSSSMLSSVTVQTYNHIAKVWTNVSIFSNIAWLWHKNLRKTIISSPPAGTGDARNFVDITVSSTKLPSVLMKWYTCLNTFQSRFFLLRIKYINRLMKV